MGRGCPYDSVHSQGSRFSIQRLSAGQRHFRHSEAVGWAEVFSPLRGCWLGKVIFGIQRLLAGLRLFMRHGGFHQ